MKRLTIFTLSMATALTNIPPAIAFPAIVAPGLEAPQAQFIQYRRHYGGYYGGYRGGYYRGYRHGYHHNGGDNWAWALGGLAAGTIIGGLLTQPGYYGPGYYDGGYYGRGYYGGTYYRPRYYAPRYYRQTYYGGSAHIRWCYARYRSYSAYDNTFQPYYGPRQVCVSPYY